MYRVTREIHFCYGHRLLDYEGKCRHLHGHNGRALITLAAAKLDTQGMVLDFSRVKRVVGGWIDDSLDERVKNFYEANKPSFNLAEPAVHMAQILVTQFPDPNVHNLKNSKAQNDKDARTKIEVAQIAARVMAGSSSILHSGRSVPCSNRDWSRVAVPSASPAPASD